MVMRVDWCLVALLVLLSPVLSAGEGHSCSVIVRFGAASVSAQKRYSGRGWGKIGNARRSETLRPSPDRR